MIEQARTQLESQPQRLATGAGSPDVGAPAVNAQAVALDDSYNPDSVGGGIPGRIAAHDPSAAPIFLPGKPTVDLSRYYQQFGELKAATYTPTQRIGNLVADALMGLGTQPHTANDLTSRVGNVLGLTPLGVAGSAVDLIDAKRRDDLPGVIAAAAGMIPGARGGGRAAKALAMDLESRSAGAKEMGFFTRMPLYHGSGARFDAISTVPTNAPGLVLPGVSLSRSPDCE